MPDVYIAVINVVQSLSVQHHSDVRVRQHGVDAPDDVVQQLQLLLLLLQVLLHLLSLLLLLLLLLSAAALQHCCPDVQQIFAAEAAVTEVWTSSARSATCVSCTALVAARHVRRRPRAIRRCGPLSTRIHQVFRHYVMCLFDTLFSPGIEVVPTSFTSTHSSCIVISLACLSRSS